MNETVVVTLADEKHLRYAKQLFASVWLNSGLKADYLLLACNVPESKTKWFIKRGIRVKQCLPLVNHVDKKSLAYSCKVYLFHNFIKKWKRVIYLDTDILISSSLEDFYDCKGFCACAELDEQTIGDQLKNSFNQTGVVNTISKKIGLKIDLKTKAFNVGVIVFETSIINKSTFRKVAEIQKIGFKEFKYLEQAAFNFYFYKKWTKLPRIYNLQPLHYMDKYKFKKENIVAPVLHFAGYTPNNKPWNANNPYYSEWKYNLRESETIDFGSFNPAWVNYSYLYILFSELYLMFRRFIVNRHFM